MQKMVFENWYLPHLIKSLLNIQSQMSDSRQDSRLNSKCKNVEANWGVKISLWPSILQVTLMLDKARPGMDPGPTGSPAIPSHLPKVTVIKICIIIFYSKDEMILFLYHTCFKKNDPQISFMSPKPGSL